MLALIKLNGGFQVWRGLEADRLSGLDFHQISGSWVHTFAGLGFPYRKGPEARQREATAFFDFSNYPARLAGTAIGMASLAAEFFGATIAPAVGGKLAQHYGLAMPLDMAVGGSAVVFIVALLLRETARQPKCSPRAMLDAKAFL